MPEDNPIKDERSDEDKQSTRLRDKKLRIKNEQAAGDSDSRALGS